MIDSDPYGLQIWLDIILEDYDVPKDRRPRLILTQRRLQSSLALFRYGGGEHPTIRIDNVEHAFDLTQGTTNAGLRDRAMLLLLHETVHFLMYEWRLPKGHNARFAKLQAQLEHEYGTGYHESWGLSVCDGSKHGIGVYLCSG